MVRLLVPLGRNRPLRTIEPVSKKSKVAFERRIKTMNARNAEHCVICRISASWNLFVTYRHTVTCQFRFYFMNHIPL